MGYPIPPPPVIGANCAVCDGTLWDAGATPRFIHVEFEDLIKCGASPINPPNAIFVLEQDAGDPCKWEYSDVQFLIIVTIVAGQTEITCVGQGVAAGFSYFWDQDAQCTSDFTNMRVVCIAGIGSVRGTAHIDWE